MRVEELEHERVPDAVALIARRQADPDTYVGYLSTEPDAISAELADLEPDGLRGVLVTVDGEGGIVGVLGAEHDSDPPRVWWMGPYLNHGAGPDVAHRLYETARSRLPGQVRQEELACDERSRFLAAFARRHGFRAEEASVVLSRTLDAASDPHAADGTITVRTPSEAQRLAAARLHDALFPGTHSTGDRALRTEPDRVALVAVRDGAVLGYAVAEVEADGAGYIDFVGVAQPARGGGIGGALVAQACRVLRDEHRCAAVDLTVRASNTAARHLYGRLGFVEERLLQPWRKGFSLEGSA